jgi:hypothetical protein
MPVDKSKIEDAVEKHDTNTANPVHNPDEHRAYPLTPVEWGEPDLAERVNPSDVGSDRWIDSRGYPFNPDTGSKSPTDGRCNATVENWEERYGERRYCGRYPLSKFKDDVEHGYCEKHEKYANIDIHAEEVLQTGMSARSRDHIYRKLPDWQRLYIYGLHETLMGLSVHEFAPQYEMKEFDFTDAPFNPTVDRQDGPLYQIEVPHATENLDREVALWAASVDGVKMELANAQIIEDEMTVESADHAQLTSPTESDPTQEFKTIETVNEHPLNLAYSRLVTDRSKLLTYGGIAVDGELSDDDSAISQLDSLTVVQADKAEETPTADKARNAGFDVGKEYPD